MDNKRILSLLGLALRGGNLAVGEEPVEAAARARDARVLLLAANAAAEHFAQAGQCLWLCVPFTKEELGTALGRASVALTAVTDTGLANAVVHRLAEGDPARYSEAAARLEVKARRAAPPGHEKNARQGKRKPGKIPESPPKRTVSAERRAAPSQGTGSRPAARRGRPRPGARAKPYAHSHPVKKGKGSFRKRED